MQAETTRMLHLRADDEAAIALLHPQTVSIMVISVTLSLSDEKQIMSGIFSSATLNILLFGTSASYLTLHSSTISSTHIGIYTSVYFGTILICGTIRYGSTSWPITDLKCLAIASQRAPRSKLHCSCRRHHPVHDQCVRGFDAI